MKTKTIGYIALTGVLAAAILTYSFSGQVSEFQSTRFPASQPSNYDSLTACEKQEVLWQNTLSSSYKVLPEYRKFGFMQLISLSRQNIALKGNRHSDFAPAGWKKLLHARGALAKIKIISKHSKYTGIFQGADCALLRLSLTYKATGDMPVAPGLALKVLRDHAPSANISALVSLDGQGKDFNFFKYAMSNIVPIGNDFGQKMVHKILSKVSKYPEELVAHDMARIDARGEIAKETVAPRQIFFVPAKNVDFSSLEHDVRQDFLAIPAGTVLYHLYVASESLDNFDYTKYSPSQLATFLKASEYVADLVTSSEFVASEFGDDLLFFKHQLKP